MIKNQDFIIVTSHPDDRHFVWETEVQIHNFRKYGISDKLHVLVYWQWRENKKGVNLDWLTLGSKYPEVSFHFYKEDPEDLHPDVIRNVYQSTIRPFCLKKFWARFPELASKTVIYIDSDVIFTKEPPIDEWIEGDKCYVSNTRGYLGIEYMRAKAREVNLPEDHFVNVAASIIGIDPKVIIENDEQCGGAQYVLKDLPINFWQKVQEDCLLIKQRFAFENQRHFRELGALRSDRSAENAGIQSWCADMWAVLYNLYYFGKKVEAPSSMDFSWATDSDPDKLLRTYILHNAGVGPSNNHYLFDKTRYRWGQIYMDKWPWEEDLSYVDSNYGSYLYTKEIIETYAQEIQEVRQGV